jgi:FtsH-binding integral membrane protein
MRKIFLRFALLGSAVAAALTEYAYYSNLHRDAPRLDDSVYLIMCPPSMFLMLTERASVPAQMLIVTVVVVLNGLLYGTVALVLRNLFK